MSDIFLNKPTLGIIGGLGPAAGAHFLSLVTSFTRAERDSDHIDALLTSIASTPDRSAYIIEKTSENPLPKLIFAARALTSFGADIIALPCNTAVFFIEELQKSTPVPILDIVAETARFSAKKGGKAAVISTGGSAATRLYEKELRHLRVDFIPLTEEEQARADALIFGKIKKGTEDKNALCELAEMLFSRGAEKIILGCTELSLVCDINDPRFIDSLTVLAAKTVAACGKAFAKIPDFYSSEFT